MQHIRDFPLTYTYTITEDTLEFVLYIWRLHDCRKWCASFCRDINDGFHTEIYDMCDDVHLVCGNILELKLSKTKFVLQ